jgi:hypothetical protein
MAIEAKAACPVINQLSLNTTVIKKIESHLNLKIETTVEIVLN